MRVAADLIARDLRRAGYWGNSTGGAVTTITSPTAASSPYAAVSPSGAASASTVTYSYSQGSENNALDSAEQFGFRLNSGVIQYQQGSGNWQAITDINSMTVTGFTVQPNVTQVSLAQYCTGGTCAGGGCPFMNMRRYDITINAASPDGTMTRQLQETVRVRNDQFTGACP
jgi:type IV pilus assembly protein PilW